MVAEIITAAMLGFTPTQNPVGRMIAAADQQYERLGEGSFIKCNDGSILLFYNAREKSGDHDKAVILSRRSEDGGETWSDASMVRSGTESYLQSSLCRMANGSIGMTYSCMWMTDPRTAAKFFVSSADECTTWSAPVEVSGGELDYMTGAHDRLIPLSSCRLVSLVHGTVSNGHLVSYVFTSDDYGKTWVNRTPGKLDVTAHPYPINHQYGFWETSVVEYETGKLLLFGRSASGWIYECRSTDFGSTWSEPAQTDIPNPLAPMRLTRMPGTDYLLMFRNPQVDLASGWHGGARRVLSLETSADGGMTWSAPRQIEYISLEEQWFDYPYLLWDDDVLHLGYKGARTDVPGISIYYQKIPKDSLLDPQIALDKDSISFAVSSGGSAPAGQTVTVLGIDGLDVSGAEAAEDASWLTVEAGDSGSSRILTNTVSIAGLDTGTYTATVTVTAGGESAEYSVSLTVTDPSVYHKKINFGSTAVPGWEQGDAYTSGGADYADTYSVVTAGVANAAPEALYQSCERDGFDFSMPIPDGVYTVRLHIAEPYWTTLAEAAANRAMDITLEGVLVEDNLDPAAAAGAVKKAAVITHSVTVADGNLTMSVVQDASGDDAFLMGLEVIGTGGTGFMDRNRPDDDHGIHYDGKIYCLNGVPAGDEPMQSGIYLKWTDGKLTRWLNTR